jgi:hypothetical protein
LKETRYDSVHLKILSIPYEIIKNEIIKICVDALGDLISILLAIVAGIISIILRIIKRLQQILDLLIAIFYIRSIIA